MDIKNVCCFCGCAAVITQLPLPAGDMFAYRPHMPHTSLDLALFLVPEADGDISASLLEAKYGSIRLITDPSWKTACQQRLPTQNEQINQIKMLG